MKALKLMIVCATIILVTSCSKETEESQLNISDDHMFKRQTDALKKAKAMEKQVQILQAERRKNIEEQSEQ
jgi:hypothetical protein